MSSKVVVNPDVLAAQAAKAKEMGTELNSIIEEYISIMQEAKATGLRSGVAGQSLQQFIAVTSTLKGKLNNIGDGVDELVERFLENVEETDHFNL